MSQITISCPNCGFSRSLERQRIPATVKKVKCPKCQQSFAFESGEDTFLFEEIREPARAPAVEPALENVAPVQAQNQKAVREKRWEPENESKFCSSCGKKLHLKAEICPGCGVRVAPPAHALNKVALLLITFFLGGVGGHKIYQKKYLLGVLYFLFFWTYIPALVSFVEFIIYAFKSEPELQAMYPETSGGVAVFAVVIPLFGVAIIGILAAIAIPQFAAYRARAYDAAATSDLSACKTRAESYFAENRVYPTEAGKLECVASKDVALYYLSLGPEQYQLVSFHDHGKKAFLNSSEGAEIAENAREEIERQIADKYGSSVLTRTFHFVE